MNQTGTRRRTADPRPTRQTGATPAGRPGRGRRWLQKHGFWVLLMSPVLLYLLVAQFYPLVETVRLSVFDHRPTSPEPQSFTGLDNYRELFTEDRNFWRVVRNSFLWVLGSTGLQLIVGTTIALVLNQRLRLRGLWRGLMLIPWVMPVIVVAIIWRWIFDGQHGLANHYLTQIGLLDEPIVWLGSEIWVWPVLLLTATWMGSPFIALMVLAALQGISRDVLEAAAVDGTTARQRLFHVILPMIRPTLFVAGMIAVVLTWFKFEVIWALTNGGPGFATSILPTYVYTQAFQRFDFGMAGAVAATAMAIVLVVAGILAKLFGPRKD
ncbi:sugar ABC transporter permease [Phytoactinopolyspora alkaliphila]|uniref:Sugar ABC transporter permease n=1 Tax=Phytoactinopolyspora alkaliphila TaxID=1783498 RepID=A0A6N9YTQ2_9ACTN|nr:sugar ABC transporter permease [Phytoactinopolyspora alkaliphila]